MKFWYLRLLAVSVKRNHVPFGYICKGRRAFSVSLDSTTAESTASSIGEFSDNSCLSFSSLQAIRWDSQRN